MQMAAGSAGARACTFKFAAMAIGAAVFLDGLDGRIARMTNTVSDFGREMDSLADVIAFGIAPAVLAFAWGVQFVDPADRRRLRSSTCVAPDISCRSCFCCAARRGWRASTFRRIRCRRIPGGRIANISSACRFRRRPAGGGEHGLRVPTASRCTGGSFSVAWLALLGLLSFLMVSTWRYPSFKDLSLTRPRSPLTFVLLGSLIYLIWNFSQPVLLGMAACYVGSGIVIRVGRRSCGGGCGRRLRRNRSIRLAEELDWSVRWSRWWAAIRCWRRKCANCWAKRSPRRACS